jgi:hypothetical protein
LIFLFRSYILDLHFIIIIALHNHSVFNCGRR